MIMNALDEVLFWDDIETLITFTKQNSKRFYPHDFENYRKSQDSFFKSVIPDKAEFIRRLQHYAAVGKPIWIAGRNGLSDDIDADTMIKAISVSSKISNGEQKAKQASKWQENNPSFWKFYADNILHLKNNRILELTVGAGGGTNAVMKEMTECDYYMGVDIDFVCAKNADALAKYYGINGLGIATSLWKLPFDDCMFTSVCSNVGLEECREIPTIVAEAYRVLKPGGLFITQQVGTENDRELVKLLCGETEMPFPEQNLDVTSRKFREAGFSALRGEEYFGPIRFFDVGALVWFARIIQWEFPDFSVDTHLDNLLNAQKILEEHGSINGSIHRFLLVARKEKL